ncbi:MAG: hypothetical protein AAGA18_12115 [Verrucomicrobiota bacterium]
MGLNILSIDLTSVKLLFVMFLLESRLLVVSRNILLIQADDLEYTDLGTMAMAAWVSRHLTWTV